MLQGISSSTFSMAIPRSMKFLGLLSTGNPEDQTCVKYSESQKKNKAKKKA